MSASQVQTYRDVSGRAWAVSKLDALLVDPDVCMNASSIMAVGLLPDGGFLPDKAFGVARLRYLRAESAALLTILATRLWCLRTEGGRHAPW